MLTIISLKIKIKRNKSPLIINPLIFLSPFRLVLFFPGGLGTFPPPLPAGSSPNPFTEILNLLIRPHIVKLYRKL